MEFITKMQEWFNICQINKFGMHFNRMKDKNDMISINVEKNIRQNATFFIDKNCQQICIEGT